MQKKYFIQQYLHQNYSHGGIGLVDAEKVLMSEGYIPILLPHQQDFSLIAKVRRFLFLFNTLFRIPKGSAVVFLYPMYAKMTQLLVRLFMQRRSIKLVCFITDIDGIKDDDVKKLEYDISFFRKLKYFIVHNERMKKWLDERVPGSISSQIVYFDFLAKPVEFIRKKSTEIAFAGNLEKSPFLESLELLKTGQPQLHFHLYGPNQTEKILRQTNITWHGVDEPYRMPSKIKGAFGLLWDGTSIDGPGGSYGKYMQYITHHKFSLYILSSLPVIVPATTAGEELIRKYKIGIVVSSLYEIEDKIKSLSEEEYNQMQKNMQPLAQKISTGGCLQNALGEMLLFLKEE